MPPGLNPLTDGLTALRKRINLLQYYCNPSEHNAQYAQNDERKPLEQGLFCLVCTQRITENNDP